MIKIKNSSIIEKTILSTTEAVLVIPFYAVWFYHDILGWLILWTSIMAWAHRKKTSKCHCGPSELENWTNPQNNQKKIVTLVQF